MHRENGDTSRIRAETDLLSVPKGSSSPSSSEMEFRTRRIQDLLSVPSGITIEKLYYYTVTLIHRTAETKAMTSKLLPNKDDQRDGGGIPSQKMPLYQKYIKVEG